MGGGLNPQPPTNRALHKMNGPSKSGPCKSLNSIIIISTIPKSAELSGSGFVLVFLHQASMRN